MAAEIKFGQDIVEQEQGRFANDLIDQVQLRQLQGQHQGTLLPLGAILAAGGIVNGELNVVAVGANQGGALVLLCDRPLLDLLQKAALNHRRVVFDQGHIGLVMNLQVFSLAANRLVPLVGDGGKAGDRPGPTTNDAGPQGRQLGIPQGKLGGIDGGARLPRVIPIGLFN